MPNTKDLAGELFPLKVLVYGKPGVGKTLFASTFPNPHIIDCENGVKSLAGLDAVYDTFLEDPDKKGLMFKQVIEKVNEYLDTLTEEDTLIIDSLSVVNEYIDNIAQKQASDKFDRWGRTLEKTKEFVDKLLRAPFNVVMTCQEKKVTDSDGNVIAYEPFMYGQSTERIPYKFDDMYRLSVDAAGNRIIQTDKESKSEAKSRLNRTGILDKKVKWKWDENDTKTNPIFEAFLQASKTL